MRKNGLLFSLVLVLGLIFTSCEVGLGSAVDVKTPEMSIKYPTTGSTIRKAFALSGTWDDDGKIESIKVAIKPTEEGGNQKSHEYDATFDTLTKTWICVIDPLSDKDPIIDGSYEATITINDTAKHSNSKSRQFTIDNTPPVLALTRPSTIAPDEKTSTDYDSYGQDFIVSGHVGDACDSKYMSVSIYDLNNNLLYTKEKTKIDSDFSVTVASYSGEDDLKDAYEKIYGKDLEAGTKAYLCSITSYDAAESFPTDGSEQKDEDLKGNEVTYFYMYEGDLYNDVFYPFGTQNAYKILSNVFGSSEASSVSANITAEEAKSKLQDAKNQVNLGFFSLNPQNNPSYLVSGKDPLKKDGTDFVDNTNYEISNGSKIVVEIAPGLDATPLNADTLGLYLIECDENGKPLTNAKNIDILPRITDDDGKVLLDDPNAIADRKSYISKSGSTYKLMAEINMGNHSEIAVGNTYIIGVYGSDTKKIPVKNLADTYGFLFTTTGSAPELVLDSPKGSMTYWKKGSSVVVSGYTKANNSAPRLKMILEYTDDVGDTQTETVKEYNSAADYDSVENAGSGNSGVKKLAKFSYEIPADKFDQNESRQYTLSVVSSLGGFDAEVSKTILYDDDLPEITIFEPTTPQADKYDADFNLMGVDSDGNVVTKTSANENDITTGIFINGRTSFRISLSDKFNSIDKENNISKVEFFQDDAVKYTFDNITSPANQEIVIDTVAELDNNKPVLDDNKPVTIKVTTYDLAGNKATKTIERYVDQDTDKPVIMPGASGTTLKYNSKAALDAGMEAGWNDNVFVSGGQMTVKVVDDDGIKLIERFDVNGTDETAALNELRAAMNATEHPDDGVYAKVEPGNITTSTAVVSFSKYGNHWIAFRVTDKDGCVVETQPIAALVTAAAPIVSVKLGNKYVTQKTGADVDNPVTKFVSTLSIESTQKPFKIYRQVVKSGSELVDTMPGYEGNKWVELATDINDNSYTDNYTPEPYADGLTHTETVYYLVKDKSNNYSSPSKADGVYTIDNDKPTVAFNKYEYTDSTGATVEKIITPADCLSTSFSFQGTTDDVTSDIKSVTITIEDVASGIKESVNATGTTSWVSKINFSDFDGVFYDKSQNPTVARQGNKKFTVKVVDTAGNVKTSSENFIFDVDSPVINVNSILEYMPSTGLTITGTATDSYKFGKLLLVEKKDGVNTPASGTNGMDVTNKVTSVNNKGGSFSIKVPLNNVTPEDGTYSYKFEVIDEAGNNVFSKEFSTTVDLTPPELTITNPSSDTVNTGINAINENNFKFEGKIKEDHPNGIYYKVVKSGSTASAPTGDKLIDSIWENDGWSKISTSTTSWNTIHTFTEGTTGGYCEGEGYKIYVYAVDKAGNMSDPVSRTFDVDMSYPTITTNLNETALAVDSTQVVKSYANFNRKFTFKVDDSFALAETDSITVTVSKDGTILPKSGNYYYCEKGSDTNTTSFVKGKEYEINMYGSANALDALYTYTITATDKVGKTTTVTRNIRLDSHGPKVEILSPTFDTYQTSTNITVRGSAEDDSGTKSIWYLYNPSEAPDLSSISLDDFVIDGKSAGYTNSKGWKLASGTTSWNFNIEGKEGESRKLYILAFDKNDIITYLPAANEDDIVVKVDLYSPTLSETSITSSGKSTNTAFTLSGKVTDKSTVNSVTSAGNGIEKVEITYNGITKTATLNPTAETWTYTFASGSLVDNEYNFTVKATDNAGKTSELTRTVIVDTQKPEVKFTTEVDSAPTSKTKWVEGKTGNTYFSGTAKENGESGLEAIYAKVDTGSLQTLPAGNNWTLEQALSSLTENTDEDSSYHTIEVYAKDKAGNESTHIKGYFRYDKETPSLTLSKTADYVTRAEGSKVTLSGNANDGASRTVKSLKLTTEKWDGTKYISNTYTETLSTTGDFTTDITKAKLTADGKYRFTVTATDYKGNVVTKDVEVTIDTTAPTVAVPVVSSSITTGTVDDKTWYSTTQIPISTEATDPGDGSSGVTKVEYSTDNTNWSPLSNGGSAWTGTVSCNTQGENTIYVRATDGVNQVSDTKSIKVNVDTEAPKITTTIDDENVTSESTLSKTKQFTFKYKIEETAGFDDGSPSITINWAKTDGTSKTLVQDTDYTLSGPTNNVYTFALKNGYTDSTNGDYEFVIKAKDWAEKETSVTRNIRFDTKAPDLKIISPDLDSDDWLNTNGVKVTGSAEDASGTLAVWYKLDGTAPTVPTSATTTDSSWSGSGWTKANGTTNWNINFTYNQVSEGSTHKLYVAAVDKNEKTTARIEKEIKVDLYNPTLTETNIGSGGKTTNTTFTLSGTVTDVKNVSSTTYAGNGIKTVVISDGTNSYPVTPTGTTWKKEFTITDERTGGAKSDELSDGEYTFTITATDNAGKTAEETRTVKIDTQKPSVNVPTIGTGITSASVNSKTWYGNSQIPIKVTATDSGSGASGVTKVEYSTDNSNWSPLSNGTSGWEGTVTCSSQGLNTISVRATDGVGHISSNATKDVYIDTQAPSSITSSITGTYRTNARDNITFTVSATDATGGCGSIASIGIRDKTPVTTATSGKYSLTIAKADITDGAVYVTVTDALGNSADFQAFTVSKDNSAPEMNISALTDADKVTAGTQINGTIKLSGTITEDQEPKQIDICYYDTDWHHLETITDTKKLYSWTSSDINTKTLFTDGATITFCVIATDAAGNRNLDTTSGTTVTDNTTTSGGKLIPNKTPANIAAANKTTVIINQDSNRPVIKVTNLNKDASGKLILKYGTDSILEGTISDDDATGEAIVKTFIVSGTPITSASATPSGTTVFNSATGDFKFTPASTIDGSKDVYFYVVDNNDAVFYTTYSTDKSGRPFYQYKDTTKSDNNAKLSYMSDSEAPDISDVQIIPFAGSTQGTAVSPGKATTLGGTRSNKMKLKVDAADENGISKIEVTLTHENGKTWTKTYTSGASYTSDLIDLDSTFKKNGSSDGTVTIDIKVTDGADMYATYSNEFTIDFTAPVLTISNPAADITENEKAIYGSQTNNKIEAGTTDFDVESIYYAITKDGTDPAYTNIDNSALTTAGWKKMSSTSSGNIIFDGDTTSTQNGLHEDILRDIIIDKYNFASSDALNEDDENKDIYVHYLIIDKCGNSSVVKRKLLVIPNGNKPRVVLAYPDTAGQGLSGTIRIYGNAEIDIGTVEKVLVQVDTSYNGSTFDTSWETDFTTLATAKEANYTIEYLKGSSGDKGVVANGTMNWNLPINIKNEFNPAEGDDNRALAIRIYAVSNNGKLSDPVTQNFKIDTKAPIFGGSDGAQRELELVQFESGKVGDFTKITSRMPYEDGMWVKGDWYIIGSVHDSEGIKSLILNGTASGAVDIITSSGIAKADYAKLNNGANMTSTSTYKNYDMIIPLPTGTGSGIVKYSLTATDGTESNNLSTLYVNVNYDNEAPQIGLPKYTEDGTERAQNAYHENYSIVPRMADSDGFYTLKSYASDTSSGMDKIGFYFVRRTSSANYVYDPMITNGSTGNQIDISGTTYEDGLFWKTQSVTVTDNTITIASDDVNIHVGGIVKLGGATYQIKAKNNKVLTLSGTPSQEVTTAKFALALFVDNFDKKEAPGGTIQSDGYYSAPDNDDGDRMVEVWNGTSTAGTWEAQIHTSNIPDGPIELHYVVFDKSQNYSVGIVGNVNYTTYSAYTTPDVSDSASLKAAASASGTLITGFAYSFGGAGNEAYISNNAPRIAGITVGCDYSGNGTIEASEKTTKYFKEGTFLIGGKATDKPKDATSLYIASSDGTEDGDAWVTIKDKASIQFELVGGNGDLFYEYTLKDPTKGVIVSEKVTTKFSTISASDLASQTAKDQSNQVYYVPKQTDAITFDTFVYDDNGTEKPIPNSTKENPTWITIKIWDSTANTTPFTDSQNAVLKLPVSMQTIDDVKPNTVFNDLYWNSSTDNSVYMNPTTEKLEGHIELKDYLGSGFTDDNYGTDDDKVSGKVVFSGYAYDNKRLSRLSFGITTTKGSVGASAAGVMNNNNTNQAWPQTLGTPYVIFDGTKWTVSGLSDTDLASGTSWDQPYCQFKVYTDAEHGAYLNADGHKVYWELIIDTSYIQEPGKTATTGRWGLGKDLYVWVQATDGSSNNTSMTATDNITEDDATSIRPNYKVDVVPYITGVSSRLGTKADDNRSSSGRYQIAENETGIQLIGYNLNEGSANYTITTPTTSGAYPCVITKGTTEFIAINNINDNNAVGSTPEADQGKVKNKYNMQPSTFNQTLTDDVVFDVWQINSRAVYTNSGVSFVQQPIVKYNPATGNLGVAFSNGANKFSMPNGKANSYDLWEYNYASYVSNAMVFDTTGRAHAISVGIDTEPSSYKAGRMNLFDSGWGVSHNNTNSGNFDDNTNSVHLDSIGRGDANIIEQSLKSTTMAVAGNRIYVAYYDLFTDSIRFRFGYFDQSNTEKSNSVDLNQAVTYRQRNQRYDGKQWNQDSGWYVINTDNTKNGQLLSTNTDREDGWNIPEQSYSVLAGGSTGVKAGEYVDITAISGGNTKANDVVCAVWYTGRELKYSYKINPCNDNDYSSTTTSGYWSAAQTLLTNGGQYCKIEADVNGGIHIAAYDQDIKGVVYIYLPTYSTTFSKDTHYFVVDAMNGPYDEIGLDVTVSETGNTGKSYPSISYYANGLPKYAYYATGITKTSGLPTAGWANDSFTGDWDVCFVPTSSMLLRDHICVAAPKNANGVRAAVTNSTEGEKTGSFDTDNATNNGKTRGTVAGNGTTNPIMGYAIREGSIGYLEIAQRKN